MNKSVLFTVALTTWVLVGSGITHPALAEGTEGAQPLLVSIKRLSLDTALRMAQAAIHKCREQGVQVAVTVIDRGGSPQVILRDVLAMDLALSVSRDKAYTAMSFNMPTSNLVGRFSGSYSVPKTPGLLIATGGLPIQVGGQIVGGIGVSGAPEGTTDESCAIAGIAAVNAELEMLE